jgi:hypothetical protein
VIAHEAWFDEEGMANLEQMVQSAPPVKTRVALIAGQENEEYSVMEDKVHQLLAGCGIPCLVIYSSNASHGYPPEFPRLLKQAIDWIEEGN